MKNMKQKKQQSKTTYFFVDILSTDEMGRVITTGNISFDFGILLPQNILYDGNPVPLDSAITFIKNSLPNGRQISVKLIRIIERDKLKFAFVSYNVDCVKEFKEAFLKLKEGNPYKVTIDSKNDTYYKVSMDIDGTSFRGYIDKDNLEGKEYNIADPISAILCKKGKTPLDYMVFTPNVAGENILAVSGKNLTEQEANSAFETMFTNLEREIMSDDDVAFSKNILQAYPQTARQDTFLSDLDNLYVRFDGRLKIILDNFSRKKQIICIAVYIGLNITKIMTKNALFCSMLTT